jgi:hypothetical protein
VKLYSYLKINGNYNADLCYEILIEKWIVITYNTRNYKKIFFNKLMPVHPLIYMKNVARKFKKIFR